MIHDNGYVTIEVLFENGNSSGSQGLRFMPAGQHTARSIQRLFDNQPGMTVQCLLSRLEEHNEEFIRKYEITTHADRWTLVSNTRHVPNTLTRKAFGADFRIADIPDYIMRSGGHSLLIDTRHRQYGVSLEPGYVTPRDLEQSAVSTSSWYTHKMMDEVTVCS